MIYTEYLMYTKYGGVHHLQKCEKLFVPTEPFVWINRRQNKYTLHLQNNAIQQTSQQYSKLKYKAKACQGCPLEQNISDS